MRIIYNGKMMMNFGELEVGDVFQANVQGRKGPFLKIKDWYNPIYENDDCPINVVDLYDFETLAFPGDFQVKKVNADLVIE